MKPEYLEIAERIGARLCRDALWSGGRCNWTGECTGRGATTYQSLGPDVYGGTSGIALFLWRLAEATGDRIFRMTAQAAIRQALSRMPQAGCGLYAGGLGILLTAAEIQGDCHEPAMLQQAAPTPGNLDLLYGSAGAIGVLLRRHLQRGGSRWMETAVAHGDLLLLEALRSGEGWSWKTTSTARNLTGFSHGTAGIGLALLELWRATGEGRFREGAMEAFRYERSCFNPEERNWPDFRADPPSYPVLWCHGAGGIGFSRLRAWQISGDRELLAEARTAVEVTAESLHWLKGFCLCHGVAGNASQLVYASQVLGEERWMAAAGEAAAQAAERFECSGAPWVCGMGVEGNEVPGLMLGLAGIGYFYLTMADPERVPSVLMA
ncbi:MAG TPA: lanthionine synthetase LanC family protein [Bryobacteraceae bacterium]|nr:lanthionine synthetase LanC family protein [Bryobacteraceae bacterium]